MGKGKTKLTEKWLTHDKYKSWVRQGSSIHRAMCIVCRKELNVEKGVEDALKKHANAKCHIKNYNSSNPCAELETMMERSGSEYLVAAPCTWECAPILTAIGRTLLEEYNMAHRTAPDTVESALKIPWTSKMDDWLTKQADLVLRDSRDQHPSFNVLEVPEHVSNQYTGFTPIMSLQKMCTETGPKLLPKLLQRVDSKQTCSPVPRSSKVVPILPKLLPAKTVSILPKMTAPAKVVSILPSQAPMQPVSILSSPPPILSQIVTPTHLNNNNNSKNNNNNNNNDNDNDINNKNNKNNDNNNNDSNLFTICSSSSTIMDDMPRLNFIGMPKLQPIGGNSHSKLSTTVAANIQPIQQLKAPETVVDISTHIEPRKRSADAADPSCPPVKVSSSSSSDASMRRLQMNVIRKTLMVKESGTDEMSLGLPGAVGGTEIDFKISTEEDIR